MKLPINHISRVTFILLLLLSSFFSLAQKEKEKEKVIQVVAESMRNLTRNGQQVVRYLGKVNILHQGSTMTCDSAYLIKKLNIIEAYNQVVVTKDDATLYGDFLYYDGNSTSGKVKGKEVKMIQKDAKLVTDTIYFNTKLNTASYLTKGVLTNAGDTLISKRGYYYSQSKKYFFAGNVEMKGKDGRLYTDSLEYGTQDEIASFYGPTRIYNKENYAYSEKGWYDRKNSKSNFFTNAFIEKGAQKLYGQDIFYDKANGFGRAIGQVAIVDTTRKITVYGGKASFWDKKKEGEVIDNPLLVMVSDRDTLFLRSDKFILKTIPDSTLPDSSYKLVKALKTVRFFKSDLQGVCDSLIYSTKDSAISLFVKPVLWNEENQITADFIKIYTSSGQQIRKMNLEGSAFITSQEDMINFNQISGKNMLAHFTAGKLSKLDVKGNGQTVRFLRDEGKIAAVNKAESVDLIAFLKNNQVVKVSYLQKPSSSFYPIKKVDYEELNLKGFHWLDKIRPKSKIHIIPKGLDLVLTDAKPGFQRDIKK